MAEIVHPPKGGITIECPNCHWGVKYFPHDVVSGRDEDDNSRYCYFTCPKCNRSVNLIPGGPFGHASRYEDDT